MSAKHISDEKISTRFDDDVIKENTIQDEEELPSPQDVNELHDQIETLNKALREAQDKADDHWQRLLRKEADLQNVQRRADQDVENTRKFAIERLAGELLQVMDGLEQGLSYSETGKITIDTLIEGMTLTKTSLMNVLEKNGITEIDPLGEPFDPTYHEALTMQASDEMEPNRVLKVIQKGYLLNQRLLRPARVIVSKALA
jgi:molecular chaperone GrpE